MIELLRTNDLVLISLLTARLEARDIYVVVFDAFASALDGSISAVPRRLMVASEDLTEAQQVLREAEAGI